MRALVVGGGGREHALCWSLSQGGVQVFALPGSDGMCDVAQPCAGDPMSARSIVELVRARAIDLVVFGPEAPLVAGVAEEVRGEGVAVFGPDRAGAQLEGSKAYAKMVMRAAGVPTAGASLCRDFAEVERTLQLHPERTVVKADSLAGGKGVIVAEDAARARRAARKLLSQYDSVLLEERLQGRELSLMVLAVGERYLVLPPARDYKRLLDGDHGPNTGGMGAICPALDTAQAEALAEATVAPLLRTLSERGTPYRGALYAGLMLTAQGPRVLEYNVRFGDPETQALVVAVGESLAPWLDGAARGALPDAPPRARRAAVGVVLASAGYPGQPQTGAAIEGVDAAARRVRIFHAGTARRDGGWQTAGGRVLCLVGGGERVDEARQAAYDAVRDVRFDGAQHRDDIGIVPVS